MAHSPARAGSGAISTSRSHTANLQAIAGLFFLWKTLILLIVSASPGPGYDTSAKILLSGPQPQTSTPHHAAASRLVSAARGPISPVANALSHSLTRLLRWDAFYFVETAQRGYLYEQEWAFGWGYTRIVSKLAQVLPESLLPASLLREVLAGVVLSHFTHLLCCLFIYILTLRVLPHGVQHRRNIATLAACLHILSPAGVFLSAPYTESPFACLNVLGFLLLTFAAEPPASLQAAVTYALCAVGGGLCFALSSTVRGNGLLSVAAVAVHGLPIARRFLAGVFSVKDFYALAISAAAALLTIIGFATPQYIAYSSYCMGKGDAIELRPWCSNTLPSIYTFVQQYYWNNGFLKYWTISNIPLFAIALPVLWLLQLTAWSAVEPLMMALRSATPPHRAIISLAATAAPQLILAGLAFTSFHVQITNRISSGYPIWCIALATALAGSSRDNTTTIPVLSYIGSRRVQKNIVKVMMLYSIIQAGLFASFLPPA